MSKRRVIHRNLMKNASFLLFIVVLVLSACSNNEAQTTISGSEGKVKSQEVTPDEHMTSQHMLYVNDRDANVVQVIHPESNNTLKTIQVEKTPTYNEVSPNGKYDFVVNSGSENVSIIDTQTKQNIKTIPVGKTPKGINFSFDGKWAYVINEGDGTVTVIDVQKLEAAKTIEVGQSPHNGVASPDSNKFYVTNTGSNSVSVINISTQKVMKTIEGINGAPHNLDISGNTLLVTLTEYNGIGVIDLEKGEMTDRIATGTGHHVIDVTPDGKYAYVANIGTNFVSVIDIEQRKEVKEIKVGNGPHGVTVSLNGKKAYVAVSRENKVAVINTSKNEVVDSIDTKKFPFFISTIENK
ncbi:40-residue YVTN family beta-propeller repeat-containing protein [Thalassobacillus cyri]|uniref:40-residue YVTN family beta-propeller repeat-containing protein n=1 Tax=Thalassobacillus cyri TaxID=571932 RepID=A0A1H3W690_9BACI|nr:cytochrome D1 domain-containing protein [Thalassobacillus cyri]SDZ82605.1 40-residue YVTN family beta-propeller repeat-containing protein [Thalassobacillus cyri]